VTLSGASNFRSLGGMRSDDGRALRPHAILRADRLSALSTDDWAVLTTIGVSTICDLRSLAERERHPTRVPKHLSTRDVSLAVDADLRANSDFMQLLHADPSARGAERVMQSIYRQLPQRMAPRINSLIGLLLENRGPLLVHCTAGKDRTGFAVAILLSALGMPWDRVCADYLLSRQWAGAVAHRPSLTRRLKDYVPKNAMPEVVDAVLDARQHYLDAAWEVVTTQYGGVSGYLESGVEVSATVLQQLRDTLLE
jgi:protein-tyrosine phosphatase